LSPLANELAVLIGLIRVADLGGVVAVRLGQVGACSGKANGRATVEIA
jgi:hypothetical protein